MDLNEYSAPLASARHRLGGKALDVILSVLTFTIGWLIWSLVVWGQGQTPGKQILKLRVYDKTTGKPAKWGHMAIREFGLPVAVSLLIVIAFSAPLTLTSSVWGTVDLWSWQWLINIIFLVIAIGLILVYLIDPLWIFRKGKRNRLTDVILKTDVLNESPNPR